MMNQKISSNEFSKRNDGLNKTVTFRVQRIFTIGHKWYFNTREGIDKGPFLSREITEAAIKNYIEAYSS